MAVYSQKNNSMELPFDVNIYLRGKGKIVVKESKVDNIEFDNVYFEFLNNDGETLPIFDALGDVNELGCDVLSAIGIVYLTQISSYAEKVGIEDAEAFRKKCANKLIKVTGASPDDIEYNSSRKPSDN